MTVEMTADPRFAKRVVRLALTSVVALGLIYRLWIATPHANAAVSEALLIGWILMPTLLLLSLRRPVFRYAVVVPSAMVGLALIAICIAYLPPAPIPRSGWLLVCAGVLLGGLLGAWFWFRLLPVPRALDDPFAPGRWVLIAIHVTLIVLGIALLAASALP